MSQPTDLTAQRPAIPGDPTVTYRRDTMTVVNPEERMAIGSKAARDQKATEHKPFGQTSEEVYPYTYWWVVGYNKQVDVNNQASQ
jgi:hypothetical protein